MKNKNLLNICYKYFNRFIIADDLIEELSNLDRKELLKNEEVAIDNLIEKIKEICKSIPNTEDDFVNDKKKHIKGLIKKLEGAISSSDESGELKEILNKQLDTLKEDYNKGFDSHERWFAITEFINSNEYFNDCFDSLSDYELLQFISQYIHVPFPPQLSQEEFDNLVNAGINNDKRELLWRLAFNYEGKDINFDLIVDYFIKVKDGYYLTELISAVGEYLNIDSIIDKINNNDLINYLKEEKSILGRFFSEDQFNRLISKLK